ncbi:hypothetical protein LTR91_026809, partial [Friedmanniomyces endolithicus]
MVSSNPSMAATSTTSSSSTSFSVPPAPTYACPANNGQTVTDLSSVQYSLGCGEDTTMGAYGSSHVQNSFDECFALCDNFPGCMAFTYEGGNNGVGSGVCFFKNQPATLISGNAGLVGAIRLSPMPSSTSSAGMTSATYSMGMPTTYPGMNTTATNTSHAMGISSPSS